MGTSNNFSALTVKPDIRAVRWSIDLRVTFGIFLLTILASYLYYQLMQREYQQLRQLTSLNDQQLIQQIQTSISQQLSRLSSLIATQPTIAQSLLTDNIQQFTERLNPFAQQLLAEKNIDSIGFYSSDHQAVVSWTEKPADRGLSQPMDQWLNQIDLSGKNLSVFLCLVDCRQYRITALQFNQQKAGYLVASSSYSQWLNQLDLPDSRIISILTPATNRTTSTDTMVYKWGYSLQMSSDSVRAQKILSEFSKKYASINGENTPLTSFSFQSLYQLAPYPLQHADNSYLIILDDITQSALSLALSGLIFALSFFIILMLIYWFLKRQQNHPGITAPVFNPQLAGNSIAGENVPPDSSPQLLQQLDTLKKCNEDINQEMTQQTTRLHQAEGLLNSILEQTQSIIMTLDSDGQIVSSNHYLEKISGYSRAELSARKFTDLYPENSTTCTDDEQNILALISGNIKSYQHEAELKPREKSSLIILWQHSQLSAADQL